MAGTIEADECLIPDCSCGSMERRSAIFPVPPDELGHWAAGHIPLSERPFEVTHVVFGLIGPSAGDDFEMCRKDVDTRVRIFVSDSEMPPETPEPLWEDTLTTDGDEEVSKLALPVEGVTVQEGQELFVSVEMAGTTEGFVCLFSCDEMPEAVSDRAWWSNATDPPYTWASLSDFGLTSGYNVGVRGRVAR